MRAFESDYLLRQLQNLADTPSPSKEIQSRLREIPKERQEELHRQFRKGKRKDLKIPGAATATALPKTNRVRSNKERTITFPICGFR